MADNTNPVTTQTEDRVTTVLAMLVADKSHQEIVHFATSEWDVCERTVDNYIAKARAAHGAVTAKKRDRLRGRSLLRMERLYTLSLGSKQYAICVAVEKRIAALFGLDAPTQIDVNDTREERTLREKDTQTLQERLNLLRTNGGERAH